ncbi:MAG: S1 RNA-binding domain-containing protein [Clostridia bacterium]
MLKPECLYHYYNMSLQEIQFACKKKQLILGLIYDIKSDSLTVRLGSNIFATLPKENYSMYPDDFNYVYKHEKKIVCYIEDIENGNIILNRKKVMEDSFLEVKCMIGQKVTAKVLTLIDFGAFVDIGHGIKGFIPLRDLNKCRINTSFDVLSKNQVINVIIESFNDITGNFNVNYKACFNGSTCDYSRNQIVEGKIRCPLFQDGQLTGYFVEITPNLNGIFDTSSIMTYGEKRRFLIRAISKKGLKLELA